MKRRRGYFKHYNDAYSGESISQAMAEKEYFKVHLFWAIIGRANQLGKASFTEKISYFARLLSVTRSKVGRELTDFRAFFSQVSVEIQEDFVKICIHNYSEYQENRGGKRVSKKGSKGAAKSDTLKIKDKRLKIEDKKNIKKSFVFFCSLYKEFFGVGIRGPQCAERFARQIHSPDEEKLLRTAMENYREFLSWPENEYRKPKQSFATFLGTKSSGFFWREFIEPQKRQGSIASDRGWEEFMKGESCDEN